MATKVGDMYAELNLKKDKFERNLNSSEKRIQKFSANAKVALQALAIATAAVTAEIVRATNAAKEQEKQTMALRSILKELNLATKEQTDELIKYSKALRFTSVYSDQEIQAAMAMLGTFQMTSEQIKETIPRLLDMASYVSMNEGRHVELTDAAKRFGMALNDNVGLLKRWGVILNEEAVAADRYNGMLISIDENYKNQARTYLQTTEGMERARLNMIRDLEEALGEGLLPYYREFLLLMGEEIKNQEGLIPQLREIGSWIGKMGIFLMRLVNNARQGMAELGAHLTNFALGIIRLMEKIPGLGGKVEGLGRNVAFLNIGFREQATALRENERRYIQMLDDVNKKVEEINAKKPPGTPPDALLPPPIGEPEAYITPIDELNIKLEETGMRLKEIDTSTLQLAENFGEMMGTMLKSGASVEDVLKRLIGQYIRMRFLSSMGIGGSILGGFMRVFGFQHGGVTNMPMMNLRPDLAVANENPNVPEIVAPLDAKKLEGLFQVNVHSADPGTTVDIVLKGLDDKRADQLIRNVVTPAMARDSRR